MTVFDTASLLTLGLLAMALALPFTARPTPRAIPVRVRSNRR